MIRGKVITGWLQAYRSSGNVAFAGEISEVLAALALLDKRDIPALKGVDLIRASSLPAHHQVALPTARDTLKCPP